MSKIMSLFVICFALVVPSICVADNPHLVEYKGTEGPGAGKTIVFLASDHEYRGEETLPAMARILAKHYGFHCKVFFGLNPKTETIEPGSSHIKGLEALKSADLMVMFLRFQDFPHEEMQHVIDYLERGGPIVGLRTSTHAFNIKEGPYRKYAYNYNEKEFQSGFGRQVLGETWAGHYGKNHEQSSLVIPEHDAKDHPILRGVKDMHVQSGGYKADPVNGSVVLARGRILNGMQADAKPDKAKEEMPVVWTRDYRINGGKVGRAFTTTHGASEDILNPGFRRLLINGCFWAVGLEDKIDGESTVEFVGPYQPSTFSFGGYRKGVKPADLADWNSPILPAN